MKNVVFIGSGAIATAMANVMVKNDKINVTMLSIEKDVVESIKQQHVNLKYFPNFKLSKRLKATMSALVLRTADVIFLAIPSVSVVPYMKKHLRYVNPSALIVNLAKGFGEDMCIIPECLRELMPNTMTTMKGPSFAREVLDGQATAFTIASYRSECFPLFELLFAKTRIFLDYTDDVIGVEFASILKNIYAIVIGIVDANFDSANLRSLVLSRAINEIRRLMVAFGGREETIFNYCGLGDFSLTALNDMSRNRTLGLLIGKGLFVEDISRHVVLEGRIAVDVFYQKMLQSQINVHEYPIMMELVKVFNSPAYDIKGFVKHLLSK